MIDTLQQAGNNQAGAGHGRWKHVATSGRTISRFFLGRRGEFRCFLLRNLGDALSEGAGASLICEVHFCNLHLQMKRGEKFNTCV